MLRILPDPPQKYVFFGDVHGRYEHHSATWQTFKHWLADYKPDGLYCLGDLTDQSCISRFGPHIELDTEGYSHALGVDAVREEIAWARSEIRELTNLAGPACRRGLVLGNHDKRVYDWYRTHHKDADTLQPYSLIKALDLVGQGWDWQPYMRGIRLPIGPGRYGLFVTHGDKVGRGAAAKELAQHHCSGVSGHTHISEHASWTMPDGVTEQWSVAPCLCKPPAYRAAADWELGWIVMEWYPTLKHLERRTVFAQDGKVTWNGVFYTP